MDNTLDKIITEVVQNYLQEEMQPINEVNNNIPFDEFAGQLNDLKLPFTTNGVKRFYKVIGPNREIKVTMHVPHKRGKSTAKADSIRNLVRAMKESGWINIPGNAQKVPWQRWQINPNNI